MWTLELLMQRAARAPGFSFYTEKYPTIAVHGTQLLPAVEGMVTPDQAMHLRGQVVEFRDGYAFTTDAIVAFGLLHADWAIPGEWSKQMEAEIDAALGEHAAQAETSENRAARKRRKVK